MDRGRMAEHLEALRGLMEAHSTHPRPQYAEPAAPRTRTAPTNGLVGTWHLVSFERRRAGGRREYPYGHHPVGYLTYTAEGFVSVQYMAAQRPEWPEGRRDAPAETKVAAADTFNAYAGRYDYDPAAGKVTHHVEVSFLPHRIGTDLVRNVELKGRRLALSYAGGDGQPAARLVWHRAR